MAGTQVSTSVTIISSLLGYDGLSFTDMTETTYASSGSIMTIAAGSKIEIAGGFFTFSSNTEVNLTTWTDITPPASVTGKNVYVTLLPSGTAGNQTVTAEFSESPPLWSISKQGWYSSSASNVRYVALANMDATGNCTFKTKLAKNGAQVGPRLLRISTNGTNWHSQLSAFISSGTTVIASGLFRNSTAGYIWVVGRITRDVGGTSITIYGSDIADASYDTQSFTPTTGSASTFIGTIFIQP